MAGLNIDTSNVMGGEFNGDNAPVAPHSQDQYTTYADPVTGQLTLKAVANPPSGDNTNYNTLANQYGQVEQSALGQVLRNIYNMSPGQQQSMMGGQGTATPDPDHANYLQTALHYLGAPVDYFQNNAPIVPNQIPGPAGQHIIGLAADKAVQSGDWDNISDDHQQNILNLIKRQYT